MIGKCGEDGVKNYWYWEFGSTTHINAAPMHTSESTVYSLQSTARLQCITSPGAAHFISILSVCVFRCVTRHVAAHATVCTILPFNHVHQLATSATLATLAAWARTGPAWDQPGPAAADIAIYIFVTGQHSLDTRVLLFWHQEMSPSQLTPSPCREHLLSHSVHSTVFIDWLFLLSSTFSEYCLFRCISMSKWKNSTGDSCTAAQPSPSS